MSGRYVLKIFSRHFLRCLPSKTVYFGVKFLPEFLLLWFGYGSEKMSGLFMSEQFISEQLMSEQLMSEQLMSEQLMSEQLMSEQ